MLKLAPALASFHPSPFVCLIEVEKLLEVGTRHRGDCGEGESEKELDSFSTRQPIQHKLPANCTTILEIIPGSAITQRLVARSFCMQEVMERQLPW